MSSPGTSQAANPKQEGYNVRSFRTMERVEGNNVYKEYLVEDESGIFHKYGSINEMPPNVLLQVLDLERLTNEKS